MANAINEYRDFVLVAENVKKGEDGLEQFSVEVFTSPGGEGFRAAEQKIPADLRKDLGHLERRKLGADDIISLGERLADLLLPGEIRQLFRRCVDKLKSGQGLRLRLRLDPALADVPWEYIYLPRAAGARDSMGFLAFDPRVSIARHEPLPIPGDFDDTPKRRRLLAVLASPKGEEPLDLKRERKNLEEALRDVPGVDLDVVENATMRALADELVAGADIFHFAGHGIFRQTELGPTYGKMEGEGVIVLVAEDGRAAPVRAEKLAVNLQGRGVALVVLGACETGRRGDGNVWSGVAPALMRAGIPAVVAMQYGIWDDAAIEFTRSLYRALAAGFPLDYAVSAGRFAAFNRCDAVREDPELGKFWPDWGVPVLYLRSEEDFVLPAITDARERKAVARSVEEGIRKGTRTGKIRKRLVFSALAAAVAVAAVVAVLFWLGILPPQKRGPVDNHDGPKSTVELQKLEFAPSVSKESFKGNVLFSSHPRITVTGTYEGRPSDYAGTLFCCYTPANVVAKSIGRGARREELKGWKSKGPTRIKGTGPKEVPKFMMTFTPTPDNESFAADLKTTEISKSSFYVRVENNFIPKNYPAAEEKILERYRSVLEENEGCKAVIIKPAKNETLKFFFPVYEVPLSGNPDDIWDKEGGTWEVASEGKALALFSSGDDSMQLRFKNDRDVVLYPFGVRLKMSLPEGNKKKKRPSALGFCLGNQSPSFIQIKLQSVGGAESKYKVVVLENERDVTDEWLESMDNTRNEWPINWSHLDIRFYAYSGEEVLLAIDDGENFRHFRYRPKSRAFREGEGAKFAFRFEDEGAEVELTDVYVFHFDKRLMSNYTGD